jgi:pimeloyl-ACP methyl ester carboxylesterase
MKLALKEANLLITAGGAFALSGCVPLSNTMNVVSSAIADVWYGVEYPGFMRAMEPTKYTAQIIQLEPYDAKKIPVLLIHGLANSPITWRPMIKALLADPEIATHYQLWVFSYPSGYPYPYSTIYLRSELDRIDRTYPHHKSIVVIGHSNGGCIARLLVTDSGMTLWRAVFDDRSSAQVQMDANEKEIFERALIFKHQANISRVILLSAPLRGSYMASDQLGQLGSFLIELRTDLPNSIDTLKPENRFVRAINTLKVAPGIPYHVIIGDRGLGDREKSNDGIVAYWSSHLDGAASELIVPSGHASHASRQGIAEVIRILHLNLIQKSGG